MVSLDTMCIFDQCSFVLSTVGHICSVLAVECCQRCLIRQKYEDSSSGKACREAAGSGHCNIAVLV